MLSQDRQTPEQLSPPQDPQSSYGQDHTQGVARWTPPAKPLVLPVLVPAQPLPCCLLGNEGLPSCPKACPAMTSLPSHEGRRPSRLQLPSLPLQLPLLDLSHPRDSLPGPCSKRRRWGMPRRCCSVPWGPGPACPSGQVPVSEQGAVCLPSSRELCAAGGCAPDSASSTGTVAPSPEEDLWDSRHRSVLAWGAGGEYGAFG